MSAVQGVGCGEAEGSVVESLEEGGAVVLSGRSEAGGGKETSVSDGGSGAISFEEGGGPLSLEDRDFFVFLFAAAAVTAISRSNCLRSSGNISSRCESGAQRFSPTPVMSMLSSIAARNARTKRQIR